LSSHGQIQYNFLAHLTLIRITSTTPNESDNDGVDDNSDNGNDENSDNGDNDNSCNGDDENNDNGDNENNDKDDFENDRNGNEVDDNDHGGENDEQTNDGSDMNKAMQCNALPIDLACARGRRSSPQLIRLLTHQMPPLHFVCTHVSEFWNTGMMAIMDYLLSQFPQDGMLFHSGMLPFHCACCAGAPRSFLNWWWERFRDVVQVIARDMGDTSLHCYLSSSHLALNAMKSSKQRQQRCFMAVQFLVEKHLGALRSINRMGMLPFHMAAVRQAPLDVIFYLACRDPEALLCHNSDLALPDHD